MMHHPVNRYLNHPNFCILAKKYPFLKPFVRVDRNGRGHFDFNNRTALLALTRVSIQEDFSLDVVIPDDALIPTLTVRLKYIMWIESLLKLASKQINSAGVVKETNTDTSCAVDLSAKATIHPSVSISDLGSARPIKGLEIGIGASASFVLLGAKMNKWEMHGTDTNTESIEFAQANIDRNGLEKLAKVELNEEASFFGRILDKDASTFFDFTVCSPPFFPGNESRSKVKARRASSATPPDLLQYGGVGEVEFVAQMIKESKKYANRVRVFSTMVHVKRHLNELIQVARSQGVEFVRITVFMEGDIEYWCMVWSFLNWPIKPPLVKVRLPIRSKQSMQRPIEEQGPNSQSHLYSQNVLFTFYKKCLAELGFKFISNGEFEFEVICEKNTWSSQKSIRAGKRQSEGVNPKIVSEVAVKQEGGPATKVRRIDTPDEGAEIADAAGVAAIPNRETVSIRHMESLVQYCTLADYIGKDFGLHFRASSQARDEKFKIGFHFYGGKFGLEGVKQVKQYLQAKVTCAQFEVDP